MAANQYVQAAAAQLQSGATAIKSEMDKIRAEFMTYERQVTSDIDSIERNIHLLNVKLNSDQPDATVAAVHVRIRMLQSEIESKKSDLEQRRNSANQAVRGKEAAMNDLMSQSKGLQSKAGSLK